jgi:S1-C subfamily serine protease
MPDYTYEGKGLHVDGVSDGKPAAKAGVLKGDIIIQLGEYPVGNVQDYMKALGHFKKGDSTIVRVMRDGKEVSLTVTF